jgi:hypothetical protein
MGKDRTAAMFRRAATKKMRPACRKLLETTLIVLSSFTRNQQEMPMTIKTAFVAMVLALTPGLAFASCYSTHTDTSSLCAEGLTWDATAQACVAPISS